MQRIGLYYPYVHFRDEKWMKIAALYWPRMARVVPRGFPVVDHETVTALHSELDFLVDVDPQEAAAAVAPRFLRVLGDHGAELRARYLADAARGMQTNSSHEPPPVGGDFPVVTVEPTSETDHLTLPTALRPLAGLYWDEVEPGLRNALFDSGLAVATTRSRLADSLFLRWVATDPTLAWVYKCALTEELARRTRYAPTTDQVAAHSATDGWDTDRIAEALLDRQTPVVDSDFARHIGLMALEFVLPANLDDVPVEKIINLRKRYEAEFTAFNSAVSTAASDLEAELADIEDAQALREHLKVDFERRFKTPLGDLRKAMNGLHLKTATGIMNYKFELGSLTTLLATVAGQGPVTAAGVAPGAATMRQATAEARDTQLRNSPVGYLLRIERNLQPASLVQRVSRGLARGVGTGV
ncbi:DUF6236 family protein [Streptomyces sp. Amel2xC10]|uniref:DUF6236 family protein n=1 Tax=Streptomyces sp. Amel2xC10 TaxID=1305826 RepID=UPI000A082076|nr:DUF6236 family protein [Streptomyces sp. Amel2xC10]SMF70721.1 hypothetical protein SAMN02745830_05385 [Streptomyces sp. Amel2xC10]